MKPPAKNARPRTGKEVAASCCRASLKELKLCFPVAVLKMSTFESAWSVNIQNFGLSVQENMSPEQLCANKNEIPATRMIFHLMRYHQQIWPALAPAKRWRQADCALRSRKQWSTVRLQHCKCQRRQRNLNGRVIKEKKRENGTATRTVAVITAGKQCQILLW